MGVKILLADDSPTVHKVIKIILKDEPCEIVDCPKESELLDKLKQHAPAAVFLDFNFSESKTGYDLCREIKQASPTSKILVMYGTFDTVDENAIRSAQADQHVVKPFDTAKFLVQVKNLLDDGAVAVPAEKSAIEIDEGWSIRETVEKTAPSISQMTNDTMATLNDDLSDWGMMVPGVIGKSSGNPDLPPVIESKAPPVAAEPVAPVLAKPSPTTDVVLPSDDDLEYPDLGGSSDVEIDLTPAPAPRSKLVPLNELVMTEEVSLSTTEIASSAGMTQDEEIAMRIADQIRDEVESNLWAADAFEEPQPKLSVVKEEVLEDPSFSAQSDDADTVSFSDALFEDRLDQQDVLPTYSSTPASSVSAPLDLEALRPMIRDIVREVVIEYCHQNVDKVAWEVIPDLAENLIKKELQKLSDKVTRDL